MSEQGAVISRLERGGLGDKPHIYQQNGVWICRCFIDRGAGETPFIAYMDMIDANTQRELNRRCF